MPVTCEEESSLTTRDGNGVRFAGFPDGQVATRDTEVCLSRARPTSTRQALQLRKDASRQLADRGSRKVDWQAVPVEDD